MDEAILQLLDQYGPLGYERIAELSDERPGEVRQTLERLSQHGLVSLLAVGELVGDRLSPLSYWQLTDQGRKAIPSEAQETALEQRARRARERSEQAHERAQAAHERATELHKRAAEFQEHHAALERELGHDDKAEAMEHQAGREREREQNEAARAHDARAEIDGPRREGVAD